MAKPRILIADDEEGIRESLHLILSESYDVVFAANGEETLAKLRRGGFALAMLDLKMPKLDGLEALKQLKRAKVATPVIVLTAYQSIELAKDAVKLGAIDYLPKPFERTKILSAVRNALRASSGKRAKNNAV